MSISDVENNSISFIVSKDNTLNPTRYIYMNMQAHKYKFICISLSTHVYIQNHTHICHQLVFSVIYSLSATFLFWFFKIHEKISTPKAIFILNAH